MTLRELIKWGMKFQMNRYIDEETKTLTELREDLKNCVMELVAEWENKNHIKTYYLFEINGLELITDDLK